MGESTDAILAYGYNLGGEDPGYTFKEFDQDDYRVRLDWYDEDNDFEGFNWQAEKRLKEVGVEGIEIVLHCSYEVMSYILAAHHVIASRGYPEDIDFETLKTMAVVEAWDNKLKQACEALGITFNVKPGWILASMRG